MKVRLWDWRAAVFASKLESSTKLVLLALAEHMSKDCENCFPSQETIMRKTSFGKTTVIKHLKIAADSGWIQIKRKPRKGKKWKLNHYIALLPKQSSGNEPELHIGSSFSRESSSPSKQSIVREMNTNSSSNSSKRKRYRANDSFVAVDDLGNPENRLRDLIVQECGAEVWKSWFAYGCHQIQNKKIYPKTLFQQKTIEQRFGHIFNQLGFELVEPTKRTN